MSNYLELKVPVSWSAEWFGVLRREMEEEGIGVRWQKAYYHITIAFINNDEPVKAISAAFNSLLARYDAPSLTFDKIDAFETKSGGEIIINLTASRPSAEFSVLAESLRNAALNAGAEIDGSFLLHVTLGRIATQNTSLEAAKRITEGIMIKPFEMTLKEVEYRYFRGESIRRWTLGRRLSYGEINGKVMTDTWRKCKKKPELKAATEDSIKRQYMVAQEEEIDLPKAEVCNTRFLCTGDRTFGAAKKYRGKKTAVLNFANNHSIGGAPFSAGAQEESLCRCSTLLPCLKAMHKPFYQKHIDQFNAREIGYMGNDDLIYTPDVVVFKSDELTDPIYPMTMKRAEWYKVDVITCAAPEAMRMRGLPADYEAAITRRIKKILDVAAKEGVEVLILGAWGCGAFKNPSEVVARAFHSQLRNYNFEVVEFALSTKGDVSGSPFAVKG